MVNYQQKKRRINKGVLSVIVIIVILMGLNQAGLFTSVKSLVEKKLIIPFRSERYAKNQKSVDVRDVLIKSINSAAELQSIQLSEENRQLKKMLGVALPLDWQYIEASVIEFKNDKIVISMGEKQGIRIGMVAIIAEDKPILVGKVSSVSENQAVISLPSDYDSRLTVVIVANDNTGNSQNILGRGLAVGRGGDGIMVNQIVSQENVAKGNMAAYRYKERLLFIGLVSGIENDASGIFKSVKVDPALVPFKLMNVFVVND